MASLKRKNPSVPASQSTPKKRLAREERSLLSSNGFLQDVVSAKRQVRNSSMSKQAAAGGSETAFKAKLRQSHGVAKEARSSSLRSSQNVSVDEAELTLASESDIQSSQCTPREEKLDHECKPNLENAVGLLDESGRDRAESDYESMMALKKSNLVPNHAGWFSWNKIHALEQRGLPQFFRGKSTVKTPALYMDYRNSIIKKYFENPYKLLTVADLSTIFSKNIEEARQIFEFLDHWGLINYGAVLEEKLGNLAAPVPALEHILNSEERSQLSQIRNRLYSFDLPHSSLVQAKKRSSVKPVATPGSTEVAVAENLVKPEESAVEYHCNSCSTDCTKRRYHCQKQADYDLCPGCFHDGKFVADMSSVDFIFMEHVPEAMDTSSDGWTDQETLLLLEALELYGDKWNVIAEHVATKSKDQCILHFIQLPIEDLFIESTESQDTVPAVSNAVDSTSAPVINSKGCRNAEILDTHSNDPVVLKQDEHETVIPTNDNTDNAVGTDQHKTEESDAATAINAALQAAGLTASDKSIALAEAGNPVIALVAFLAALTGPDMSMMAAQTALKALSYQEPAIQIAARNSYIFETLKSESDAAKLVSNSVEIGKEALSGCGTANLVTASEEDVVNMMDAVNMEEMCTSSLAPNTDTVESDPVLPDHGTPCLNSIHEEANHILDKMKNASATALASVAVKAKLLADQEEQVILQLTASLIEIQLKKLQIKLKLYKDLGTLVNRECDKVEKAKHRLLMERAQLAIGHTNSLIKTGQFAGPNSNISTVQKIPSSRLVPANGSAINVPAICTNKMPVPSGQVPYFSSSTTLRAPNTLPLAFGPNLILPTASKPSTLLLGHNAFPLSNSAGTADALAKAPPIYTVNPSVFSEKPPDVNLASAPSSSILAAPDKIALKMSAGSIDENTVATSSVTDAAARIPSSTCHQ